MNLTRHLERSLEGNIRVVKDVDGREVDLVTFLCTLNQCQVGDKQDYEHVPVEYRDVTMWTRDKVAFFYQEDNKITLIALDRNP